MNPDIGVTERCNGKCGRRVEANSDGPKQKEGENVHSIVCESENTFLHMRHVAVSWFEVIGTGCACHPEVSLDAVRGVASEKCEESRDDGLWKNVELETAAVHPTQGKQRNEAADRQKEEACKVSSESNRLAYHRRSKLQTPCQPYEHLVNNWNSYGNLKSHRKWLAIKFPSHPNEYDKNRRTDKVQRLTDPDARWGLGSRHTKLRTLRCHLCHLLMANDKVTCWCEAQRNTGQVD